MKILIIEDERELSKSIVAYLNSESYLCEQAFTYAEALEKTSLYEYDCILLDLMLPGGSGLEILRQIRKQRSTAGVIIVSAKDSLDDKLTGLRTGADDYLPKPFHLAELSMRIHALLRRKLYANNETQQSGNIHVDLLSKQVTAHGKPVTLTRTEYELLLFFMANKNRVVSKSALAEHLSGDMADLIDSHDFVYTHIKNLKAKLKAAGEGTCIRNVYGTGYKWMEGEES